MKKKWLNYLYISGMLLLVSCTQKKCFRQNVVIRQRKLFGTAKGFKTLRKRLVEARSCQVSNLQHAGIIRQ